MDADDPFTSGDEADEVVEANRKPGEVVGKKKIKRSLKDGKKAKKLKAGGVICKSKASEASKES